MNCFIDFLDKWQTLISGILAIVAAGTGAYLLNRQISQAETHERNRLRRRLTALRATLPLTLSGLGRFAREAIVQLSQARLSLPPQHVGALPAGFEPPTTPSELVNALRETLEVTDDTSLVELISEICCEIQTLSSRMSSLNDSVQMAHMVGQGDTIDQYLIQAARLYALIEGLFDFARRRDDGGPKAISWDRVHAAFNAVNLDEQQFAPMFQALIKRKNRLPVAWEIEAP